MMRFLDILFEKSGQAAPIMQAVPVTQATPVAQTIPATQATPAISDATPISPNNVNKWQALIERITQPEVLGPLQTFVAAATAPLGPGETLGGRLSYAGALMQMHKNMLEENAKMAPYLEKMRALELQAKEKDIEHRSAQIAESQARTRKTDEETDFNKRTQDTRIKLLKHQIDQAIAAGDAAKAAKLLDEYKFTLEKQFGAAKRQAEIDHLKALTKAMLRGPVEKAQTSSLELSNEDFIKTYDAIVLQPFRRWVEAQKAAGMDYDWNTYLNDNPGARQIFLAMQKEANRRGIPFSTINVMPPQKQSAPQPVQKQTPQNKRVPGTPEYPIERPDPRNK